MNPTKVKIEEYLNSLPSELFPLKEAGRRYLKYCCAIDTDESVHIAHRPWVAPLNYAMTFFSPAKKVWIKRFEIKRIPEPYQEILLATNGLFAFGISLFGLAPSMQLSPPRLDRSRLQCLDISLANNDWIGRYEVDQDLFHFGSREFSYTENTGYFMTDESKIQSYRTSGELVQEWKGLSEFLEHELCIAEQIAKEQMAEDWWC